MKEKVILNRTNGEKEEKKLIAHFKVLDDNKPNIKNVPILILDKQELNNGNNVLEFMWEKNGVYQNINDENAWSEVKATVVDIIKNNALNLSYIPDDNLQADIGPGRSLGLTVAQTDPLIANFKSFVEKVNTPVKEETLTETIPSVVSEPVIQNPINNEVLNNEPVVDLPQSPVNEEVITPFASDAPAIENVINSTPVIEDSTGPEIIEESKENDFDKMQLEIENATREYQEKIKSIIDAYKKKITTTIDQANLLKEQAADHLKNAEAREQIANMAYQNSVINNANLEIQKIA